MADMSPDLSRPSFGSGASASEPDDESGQTASYASKKCPPSPHHGVVWHRCLNRTGPLYPKDARHVRREPSMSSPELAVPMENGQSEELRT